MKKFIFAYPGDSVLTGYVYNTAEFLEKYSDRNIYLVTSRETITVEAPPDSIVCDMCNEGITGEITVVDNRAYCPNCAKQYIIPHATFDGLLDVLD